MAPNLLLVMADQLRWDWLGCEGTPGVHTPNLDALASRGVRFTQCTTNSAVCAPARIALASGQLPTRLQALDNSAVLPTTTPTYYQALRDNGYRVGLVGKLDLDKPVQYKAAGDRPVLFSYGFTHPLEVEGKMMGGNVPEGVPRGPYGRWLAERGLWKQFNADYTTRVPGIFVSMFGDDPPTDDLYRDSVLPADAFADTWIGDQAVEWLERIGDDTPWHLFVSFAGPHDPFDPPTELADRFRDAPVPPPLLDGFAGKPARARGHAWDFDADQFLTARRQYTASLDAVDEAVGRILAALDRRGMADDTVVVFTSDHGELLGDHWIFQKHFPYEPAMRVPLVATGPGVGRGVSDALVELADLNPTLCELAGVSPHAGIDARSFRACLDDPDASHREIATCAESPYHAVRTATHKYVRNFADVPELYELTTDPGETHNLVEEQPRLAADMDDALVEAFAGTV